MEPQLTFGAFDDISNAGGAVDPAHVEAIRRQMVRDTLVQVARLAVDRWIGLEGAMVLSAYSEKSAQTFLDGLFEDPRAGNSSIYQRISGANYKKSDKFTFLTVPGPAAVLYYSGSPTVVFLGMGVLLSLVLFSEWLALGATRSEFVAAMAAVTAGNFVCQMNFPYLGLVYFIELWVALGCFWFLLRPGRTPLRVPKSPEAVGRSS